MVICFWCSIGFTAVGLLSIKALLAFTNVPEEIYEPCIQYLTIIIALLPVQIIYNMCAGVLRAVGDSKKPFYYLVVAAFINISLDLLFVIKFGMGIRGVAWATVIAQTIAAILIMAEMFTTRLDVNLAIKDWHPNKEIEKEMLKVGFPSALMMGISSLSHVFVQYYVNGLGTGFIGGFNTFMKVESTLFMASNSIGVAAMTFVSQNLGAGDETRARKGANVAIWPVT